MNATIAQSTSVFEDCLREAGVNPEFGNHSWVALRRQALWKSFFAKSVMQSGREAFKFMDLKPLLDTPYMHADRVATPFEFADIRRFIKTQTDPANARLVFLNGRFAPEYSFLPQTSEAVILDLRRAFFSYEEVLWKSLFGDSGAAQSRPFWLMNGYSFQEGAFIYVPDGVKLDFGIELVFIQSLDESSVVAFYPRSLVVLGKGARASVKTRYASFGTNRLFVNSSLNLAVGEGAHLEWLGESSAGDHARHAVNVYGELEADATLAGTDFFAADKASLVVDAVIKLKGPRARLDLAGVGILRNTSSLHRSYEVIHEAPLAVSRQNFRHIVSDRARAEFASLVQVEKNALGSDSNQLNRNLVLSDEARAYSRPQLKIDNDDVKASHGSTVGNLEDTEVFYLKTRGIEEVAAKSLLAKAFAAEIIDRVGAGALRDRWQAEAAGELERLFSGSGTEKS